MNPITPTRLLRPALGALLLVGAAATALAISGAPVGTDKAEVSYRNPAAFTDMDRSFGEQAQDTYVNFTWNKVNQAGRPVAPGVYFMLVREQPTQGEVTPLQMVKKILLP